MLTTIRHSGVNDMVKEVLPGNPMEMSMGFFVLISPLSVGFILLAVMGAIIYEYRRREVIIAERLRIGLKSPLIL